MNEDETFKLKLSINIGFLALSYYMTNGNFTPNTVLIFKIVLLFYTIGLFIGAMTISNIFEKIKNELIYFYNLYFDILTIAILLILILTGMADNWLKNSIILTSFILAIIFLIIIIKKLEKNKLRNNKPKRK